MKILLLGEYSNLHNTLARGLDYLGHEVVVASDGDGFKNYPRNIDLKRDSSSLKDTAKAIGKVIRNLNNFKGFDVVQVINPCFTTLNVDINKYLYRFLSRNNDKIFLGAFGDDTFWLKACLNNSTFRYSEFFEEGIEHDMESNERLKALWLNTDREKLNIEIAHNCNGIIACLPEYYMSYFDIYKDKLTYIPLPIDVNTVVKQDYNLDQQINFFIGINRDRSQFKGTDRLYNALLNIQSKYLSDIHVKEVHSVPYNQYVELMSKSHVVLDQLYSYSPAMNGLLAMAQGKVLVGGGEPEVYEMLEETENKPIVNVIPCETDIYNKLEYLIQNKSMLNTIANNSRIFVEKHHDHIKVARRYLDFWSKN